MVHLSARVSGPRLPIRALASVSNIGYMTTPWLYVNLMQRIGIHNYMRLVYSSWLFSQGTDKPKWC